MVRVTQGVRLINLKDDTKVASISVINKSEEEDEIETDEISEEINEN